MLNLRIVWFDSLGAKSSCILVTTPDVKILIDPGVAIMHRSFPAPDRLKARWAEEGRAAIRAAAREAEVIVISHYHYDHFTDFDRELYEGKLVIAKSPNEYINDSQRGRAMRFFRHLYGALGIELDEILGDPYRGPWRDPLESLLIARKRDFGDYNERRRALLDRGREWFRRRVERWSSYRRVPEIKVGEVEVRFAEGREFKFDGTIVRFTEPLFHGIEYSRVGWVFATLIEYGGWKLIHSSDLNGPIIEDYAGWIIEEDPDILVLDGPMTYMLGYTLNLINFRRTIDNALNIVERTTTSLIIYDHHLPREPKFRERTRDVWELGKKLGKRVITAAEYLGREPVVLMSALAAD